MAPRIVRRVAGRMVSVCACRKRGCRWTSGRILADQRGAAGLEMAFVMLVLMMFIIGIIEVGYTFYVQQALDFALMQAIRQVATGQLQSSATSLASFQSVAFCPAVGPFLPCASIAVNVQPVSGFTASTVAVPMSGGSFNPSGFEYCPGAPGQLMMAQAVYPAPTFLLKFLPGGTTTYQGQTVRLISSAAGFVNEYYTPTASAPAGC
jgi:Flp pilus assembly protein TadG